MKTMDRETQAHYYNRCNPDEPLQPADERNVDIDAVGSAEDQLVRGANWVDVLATRIELSEEHVCEFFTGLPGSGKSTELLRLVERLGHTDGAHILPVLINAEEVLDLFNPIDVPDILVVVLYSVERAVLKAEKRNPDSALQDGYLTRIAHWLRHTDVELSSLQAGAKAPGGAAEAKAILEMKTRPSFREEVRQRIANNLPTFLGHAREETEALGERARKAGYAGLVTIVDSLEKLRGISTNWNEVLESGERVFAGEAPNLRLPMHMVFTIPPALIWRLHVPVQFMPMLKLHDRETGERFAQGYDTARQLVAHRLPSEALEEIFGPCYEDRLDDLIEWSGGYPREIVRLLQTFIGQAPVSEALFQRLLSQAGDNYRRTVPEEAFPLLARVALDKHLPVGKDSRALVALTLENNVVLRYQNYTEWFDLHPALRESAQLRKAVQDLKQERLRKREPSEQRIGDH